MEKIYIPMQKADRGTRFYVETQSEKNNGKRRDNLV